MSLPPCFATPDQVANAIPLVLMNRSEFASWRDLQTSQVQAWLSAQGFTASGGSFLLIPDSEGKVGLVAVGVNDTNDVYALSHLPTLLPAQHAYRITNASPSKMQASLALLSWGLGAYKFNRYIETKPVARLCLEAVENDSETFAMLKATTLVRDLINTPTEHMGPEEMEAVVIRIAQAYGGTVTIIAGDDLLKQNFPTIHAVGRASHRAPRLIELNWGNEAHPKISIVGKGVCFDTGGLDIKTADGMRNMKKDMGGGAHAIGLAQLIMATGLPVRLQMLVPAVENAISSNAFRPGEVIVTRTGLSVEVDNTDAEGRLVLCDALAYACESSPELLLDFATLTGAARIALGPDLPALFCNNEKLAADYLLAGEQTSDRLWRMPLWRPYLSYLKSNIADLANGGPSRMAGCISAALYLERFVREGMVWSHVDVYSWNDGERPGRPAGGEAQGLRAVYAMLKKRYRNS
ncbi:MAG: leucyl aminopeptidase family protein [Arenimonas sp.]